MSEKRGAPWWIWALMIIAVLYAIGNTVENQETTQSKSNDYSASQETTSPTSDPVEDLKQIWTYSSFDDQMSSKKILSASIESSNQFSFGFPYTGLQRATLQLRKHPRYGNDVILMVEKGQFLTKYDGTVILVRFDDGESIRFTAFESDDHDTKVLFIQGYDRFVSRLKKSSIVKIEAPFYQEGNRVFEFAVSGIDSSKI